MEDLRSHIKECKWDRDGFASRYSLEIRHEGLNEYRCLTSDDDDVLLNKAYSQIKKWEEKWNTVKKKIDTEKNKIASKTEAEIKTRDAIHNLKEIDDLLIYTLSKNDVVDWEQ